MKTLSLLISLLISAITCSAQLKVGDTWNYNYYYYITYPNAIYDVSTMKVAQDTVISGFSCLQLTQSQGTPCRAIKSNIIREEQNRIYYWKASTSSFELMYDFNLNEGESYTMNTDYGSTVITIDSTSTLNFNGKTLKVQYISSENHIVEIYGATVQGIGNLRFFFPGHGACDPFSYDGVRCFTNDNGTLKFDVTDCEVISGINELSEDDILIYPNPTTHFITVSNPFAGEVLYEIIDVTGKVISSKNSSESKTIFDLNSLQKGYYFLKRTDVKTNSSVIKQLVKS